MDYLQGMVKSMPANKVSFAGFVPHNQLPSFFELADVLVQSSVWDEPFGIPVVEAMAAGLPVVSSRSGGLPEIIVDGTTGLLVERDNPAALAEAMSRLISNNEMALNMGAAGKSRAKALFSWDVVTARLLALYEVLISATLRELPKNISG
jgi:glycosyltransferase involved in cell wall biosynthesis